MPFKIKKTKIKKKCNLSKASHINACRTTLSHLLKNTFAASLGRNTTKYQVEYLFMR